jgi:hypothetical protein
MDQTQDFKSLQDQIQAALIATTRTTGQISSEDLGFHRSFNPEVGAALDEQSERLLPWLAHCSSLRLLYLNYVRQFFKKRMMWKIIGGALWMLLIPYWRSLTLASTNTLG